MARLITRNPDYKSGAEQEVVEALVEQLPDEWAIAHSAAWTSTDRRGRTQEDGECDVVVLGPTGLATVEVKGGRISRDGSNNFYSTDRFGARHEISNPVRQAQDAKHTLKRAIKQHFNTEHPMAHVVAFPDCNKNGTSLLGLDLEGGVLVDGDSLPEAGKHIAALLHADEWQPMPLAEFERICELLEPSWQLGGVLGLEVVDVSEQAAELTEDQHRAIQGLRANPRVVITGCAGSGKSIIALRLVAEAAQANKAVLYVCYNRLLAAHQLEIVERASPQNLPRVTTFHTLVDEWLKASGIDIGPQPASGDRQGWQEYFDHMVALAIEHTAVATEFDTIVIDEGQDFKQSWIDLLELGLADSDSSMFYMFLDPAQNIFQSGDPPKIEGAVQYDLGTNCRTGDALAKSIAKLLGDPEPVCGIEGGFPIEVIECSDEAHADEQLRTLLHRLVAEEGIRPNDIVVQTMARVDRSRYWGKQFGNLTLVGRKSTADAPPPLGPNDVRIDTVHSLKGLETPTTVIVETEHIREEHKNSLLRVGLTRATTFAALIKIADEAD
ncbi:MAG: hypothetical protein DCC49_10480 [Acidobacteria bacterium]|nr:MAG: hypothetical protein DCC49_10480 [Acidobacteriota bacterium]